MREVKKPRKKYEPPLRHWLGGTFGQTLRDLQALPPEKCADINAALLAWAADMARVNPPVFAAYLYAALGDTWEWNRRNLYPELRPALAPEGHVDHTTVRHHGRFLYALALAQGDEQAARFYTRDDPDFKPPLREVPGEPPPAELPDDAPDELPGDNVVDINCWTQYHARPIRNLLFAEKGDAK